MFYTLILNVRNRYIWQRNIQIGVIFFFFTKSYFWTFKSIPGFGCYKQCAVNVTVTLKFNLITISSWHWQIWNCWEIYLSVRKYRLMNFTALSWWLFTHTTLIVQAPQINAWDLYSKEAHLPARTSFVGEGAKFPAFVWVCYCHEALPITRGRGASVYIFARTLGQAQAKPRSTLSLDPRLSIWWFPLGK